MNQRERVVRSIGFSGPDRVPVWHFNRDHTQGDILKYSLALPGENGETEWGYRWTSLGDGTMGQPDKPVLPDWDDFDRYRFPAQRETERLRGISGFLRESQGYYRLAGCGISGFTTFTFLRGFENAVSDIYMEPEWTSKLLDGIFGFENDMISLAAKIGMDGYHFEDDWGTQQSLIVSPETWRKVFKPRYRAQFEHAHQLGLHVWFHSCGNITSIIPDFHEIGVDVMNISQPNVVDLEDIGNRFRGKQCFMIPVSYQTTGISATPDEIEQDALQMHSLFATSRGGFIGYVEEYQCVGMSEENYQACVRGFRSLPTE